MMGNTEDKSDIRPIWMLTHPFGGFMGSESIRGLNLSTFSHIFFVIHRDYECKYEFTKSFIEDVQEMHPHILIEFVMLDSNTHSQAETVYRCIVERNISGPILIKDSDNYFSIDNLSANDNYVCYYDLNEGSRSNIQNKSYIQFDSNGYVLDIVEKKVITSTFSVGGYGFKSADEFTHTFEHLSGYTTTIYMSNIIFQMLLSNYKFRGVKVSDYNDWGTLEDWDEYKSTFKTLFVDLDGTLIQNTSPKMKPYIGTGQPLIDNIKYLNTLYKNGRTKIIITTARPEKYRRLTIDELNLHNIPYDELIMNLPHSQRIIINDFANSNRYPSCMSINLHRNSNTLRDYFI